MQQTERLLVLYKQEGTAGHLACGGSTLFGQALTTTTDEVTLGCAGLLDIPSHKHNWPLA